MATNSLSAPIRWFGSKTNLSRHLVRLIPPHRIYVEVFGGSAALLFAKPPAEVEVYNDLDSGLVGFFRVLRDPEKSKELQRLASLTPYSREEYLLYRKTWHLAEDDVERAYKWFVVAQMSFSGFFGQAWSFSPALDRASNWFSYCDKIPEFHRRIRNVQVDQRDFREIIPAYDSPETFFYLDPPYIPDVRRDGSYNHEMAENDHRELVDILLNIRGKAMLSGYKHSLYKPLEDAGWTTKSWRVVASSAARTKATGLQGPGSSKRQQRVETVWMNYSLIQPAFWNIEIDDHQGNGTDSEVPDYNEG